MKLELAKEFYFREFDDKAQQDARMGVFVALLTALASAIVFLVRSAWPPATFWTRVSMVSSGGAVVLYVLAVIRVLRAMPGPLFEKLPSPDNLLVYWENLVLYHTAYPDQGSASDDFEDYLVRHFATAGTTNASNNLARSAHYWYASRLLLWVVVLSGLAALFLAVGHFVPVLV